MALRRRKKDRELMVTKALLLGYTFPFYDRADLTGRIVVRDPEGKFLSEYIHSPTGRILGQSHRKFPAVWVAARAALIHAGVIDAPEPSGDHRANPSAGG